MNETVDMGPVKRRQKPKRYLTAEQKYELWLAVIRGEATAAEAAARAGVDRTTVVTIKHVAKEGALAALAASRPGKKRSAAEISDTNRLEAEVTRLSEAIKELSIENVSLRSKTSWG